MDSPYLTKKELGQYLKCSRWIIERLMRDGLPYICLGRKILFIKDEVDQYMKRLAIDFMIVHQKEREEKK